MPNIPQFDNTASTLHPGGAAQISPAAMAKAGEAAAAQGEAVARGGEQFSAAMDEFNQKYVGAAESADASHITAQASEALGNLQHKWSLTPNRADAQAGFDTDVAAARKQIVGSISDPIVQARVSTQFDQEVASRRGDTAAAAFRLESSTRRGQLDTDLNTLANSAAGASNPVLQAQLANNATTAISTAKEAGWLDPETADKLDLSFKSQVQEVKARSLMNAAIDKQDGTEAHALAAQLSDPGQFPGLLPERREVLQTRLENLGYRLDTRAASKLAHQDSVAERSLHQAQGHNEATLLAGIDGGKSDLSDSDIQHLADTQQISAGGVEALHAAKVRQENGIDDPKATLGLWHAIGTKQATSGMIYDAMGSGAISRNTATTMMRSLDAGANKQQDQVTRGNYEQLKTALHGGAVEQGIIPDKSPAAAVWAQAQGEWNRRVKLNGESPTTVLPDMLSRYGQGTATPTYLDQPKLGMVQSAADIAAVAKKTGDALKAGKISPSDFNSQLQLLSRYKQFYGSPAVKAPARPPSGATP
jgi:hypothetical protein